MPARVVQSFLCAVTALALASLLVSYNRLVHSVESAAAAARLIA